jgi:gliding motility-associated-like protein
MKHSLSLLRCSRFIAIAFFLLSGSVMRAQMVGTNAYIKATSVEIGIAGAGGFEGCDVTVSPPPAGMHYRSGTSYFGFVANPQLNAWATFDGDFFTPGSPENGWGFEIGTSGVKGGNNCSNLQQVNGSITNWSHNFSCYSADWEGDATSGTDLHFKINYFLQETDLFYTTTISITNNTSATIPDLYYYRNLDPDNNQPISGDFYTTNSIVSQPGTGCNLAHVSATQSTPWNSYLGLAAIGANWRASYGGFANRDASDLWSGAGFSQVVGSSAFVDEAIALAYRIQNLAPGATETIKFVVILDNAAATNAINNLLYFTYPGAIGAPAATCSSAAADTVRTCGSPVSIAVNGSNVSDYTWTWSPASGLSSTTGTTVTANPATTTTYTASGAPISACLNPINMSVVVEVTPGGGTPPVIAAVPPLCISSPPITLTADSTGGVWSGTGITNSATGVFDPAVAGIGSFIITYGIPGICNTADTVMITIDSTADATISDPPSVCISGSAVNFSAATSGGTWSGTGITSGAAGTFDPAVAGLGTHVITYSISGICASLDSSTVEVTSLFDPTITPPATVCEGTPAYTMNAAHPGGVWTGTGITDSLAGTYTPSTAGTHQIIYTIPGSCGNTDTISVTVLNTPDVTITPDFSVCLSSPPITLSADSTGGTWAGPGITSASGGIFSPGIAGLGTHLITYTTTSTCNTLDSVFIQVTTTSDATIFQPASVCVSGTPVNFTAVTGGGTWSGTGITNAATGTFDPVTAGLGFHQITYTISGACANQDTMLVEVTNLFNVTITQPLNLCHNGSPITLTAAHPGGVWAGTGITDPLNGIYTPGTLGVHPVSYTITGACGNTDTVDVTVIPSADATITTVSPVCAGSSSFNLSAVTPGGVWSGTGITNSATGTFDPTVAGVGTFIITYGVSGVCGDTSTVSVTVRPLPVPTFTAPVTSACIPACIQFYEGVSPFCSSVIYDFGDGDTTSASNPVHCFDSAGVYTVGMQCTDIYGCVGTAIDSNMITANPIPEASFTFSPSDLVEVGSPVTMVNTSTAGTSSYWTFGDSTGFSNGTIANSPIHYYDEAGQYCVTLISVSASGCRDTASDCLDIFDPVLMIPNVFTPNGDNNNDVWRVLSSGVKTFTCSIYNRWGHKVAEWSGIEQGWNGEGSPDGTYYYIIKATMLNEENLEKQGFIQLLSN